MEDSIIIDRTANSDELPLKCNFVLIGYVDHGKSTCAGRILVDTEMVSDKDIRKAVQDADENGMKTWWLAYLLDENYEERIKGKTHEYIINRGNYILNMIDVPGHNQFMVVVLVCSIKTGEFEKGLKGQIYEHLILSRCMGITDLIVAINKIDSIGWDEDHGTALGIFNDTKNKIARIIKKLNFKSVNFVPISALNGWNVVHRMRGYESLLDIIENTNITKIQLVENNHKDLNIIRAKCIFMNIKTLITSGFTAVLHSGNTVIDCTINEITTKSGKPFVTNKDVDYIDVTIELSRKCNLESYIIIRSSELTIAIGRLI